MIKLEVPAGVTHLSIDGEAIEVKNGFCEVKAITPFLRDNGFKIVEAEAPKQKTSKKEKVAEPLPIDEGQGAE